MSIILALPVAITYLWAAFSMRADCRATFTWFPPTCSLSIGDLLEREGISAVIPHDLPDCEDIEKGWCMTEEYREGVTTHMIETDGVKYAIKVGTSTLKGVDIMGALMNTD